MKDLGKRISSVPDNARLAVRIDFSGCSTIIAIVDRKQFIMKKIAQVIECYFKRFFWVEVAVLFVVLIMLLGKA